MILPIGLVLFGSLLIYSGWTGRSFTKLLIHPGLQTPGGPGADEPLPEPEPDEPDEVDV